MWFRNLQLFRLAQPFTLSAEELDERLQEGLFRRCGSLEMSTFGWVPPLGRKGTQLVHAANGYLMLCACKEDKILPASVVRALANERAAQIEEAQARPVRRKERMALREEVLHDLLPRALTRTARMFAYIAPRDGWLVVDSPNRKRAEELVSLLRKSLGNLEAAPPRVQDDPAGVLTGWLVAGDCGGRFTLGDECELRARDKEGAVVRCRRQDLTAEEIRGHLKAGKRVAKLALGWNERVEFVLSEDLGIKRLRFQDIVQEQTADVAADDEIARFDADFAVMTLELKPFLADLLAAFGGEAVEARRKTATA